MTANMPLVRMEKLSKPDRWVCEPADSNNTQWETHDVASALADRQTKIVCVTNCARQCERMIFFPFFLFFFSYTSFLPMVNCRPGVAEIRQLCGFSEAWLCLLISDEGNEMGGRRDFNHSCRFKDTYQSLIMRIENTMSHWATRATRGRTGVDL